MSFREQNVGELDLHRYWRIFRKRWWLVAIGVVAIVSIAVVQTVRTIPIYRAEVKLFVGLEQVREEEVSLGAARLIFAQQLLNSYVVMLSTRPIAQSAIELDQLPLTPNQVVGGVAAKRVEESQLLSVTFSSPDPELAARAVNSITKAFELRVEDIGGVKGGEPAVNIDIIEPAEVPSAPVSPSPTRNVSVGFVAGLLLGIGLAYLADALDLSVKSREDVEHLGLPVIGVIPALETRGAAVHVEGDPQGVGSEGFRKVRTSIGFKSLELPVRSVLITSPIAGEGKTTVAVNLAAAYASGSVRTLLMEADLRRPSLHELFDMDGASGLTTVITGQVSLDDACKATRVTNLHVMLAGAIPPNPVELLDSESMSDIMAQLYECFDMVIVDSPPLIPVADPAALAARCDGVVIVARASKTHRTRLTESVQIVERAGGRLLGVLLNRQRRADTAYGAYYYSYRSDRQASIAPETTETKRWSL